MPKIDFEFLLLHKITGFCIIFREINYTFKVVNMKPIIWVQKKSKLSILLDIYAILHKNSIHAAVLLHECTELFGLKKYR